MSWGIKDAKAPAVTFPGSGAGCEPSTPRGMCFAVERGLKEHDILAFFWS